MRYRAKRACIVGGMFRRAGEVFEHEPYQVLPDHLVAVGEDEGRDGDDVSSVEAAAKPAAKRGRPAKAADPGPGLAELGEGTPAGVETVTSSPYQAID